MESESSDESSSEEEQLGFFGPGAIVEATAAAFGPEYAEEHEGETYRGKIVRKKPGQDVVWVVRYDDGETVATWEEDLALVRGVEPRRTRKKVTSYSEMDDRHFEELMGSPLSSQKKLLRRGDEQKTTKKKKKTSKKKQDDDDDTVDLEIERLLCRCTATKEQWASATKQMTTRHVTTGSVWDQEEASVDGERFLVKWKGLSYIHVSWETFADLESEIGENVKRAVQSLSKREDSGEAFELESPDERKDVVDPSFVDVERVLDLMTDDDTLSETPTGATRVLKTDLQKRVNAVAEEILLFTAETTGAAAASSSGTTDDDGQDDDDDDDDGQDDSDSGAASKKKKKKTNAELCALLFDDDDQEEESKKAGKTKLYVKWRGLGYADCTEETYEDVESFGLEKQDTDSAIVACLKRFWPKLRSKKNKKSLEKAHKSKEDLVLAAVPTRPKDSEEEDSSTSLKLRDYQVQGSAWLAYNYLEKRSCVLADEMGLGKTVQTVTFLRMVKDECYNARDPALVIAPLSTLEHWQREFATWTDLDVAVYHGSVEDREAARNEDLFVRSKSLKKKTLDVDVLITTYEQILLDDSRKLAEAKYSVIVVDEAHRLKNPNARFYKTLSGELTSSRTKPHWSSRMKVLLTGTPLQNDVKELWAILSFCDDSEFADCDDFVQEYQACSSSDDDNDENNVLSSLLDRMRPYVLRREKAHVERAVPPKAEIVVDVALSKTQKRCYRALYEKNVAMLAAGAPKDGPSLTNLAMELRKCCNHPFLLKGVEENLGGGGGGSSSSSSIDALVDACGKLQFLDKLLPKLEAQKSKVLIFSQFTMMLNVLEDYLDGRNLEFGRIDGGVTGRDRQREIDDFCDPNSKKVVMLLSTRAGGVGINLVAADTVVIYDSDWNPQNDVQAMARCHRIGQTKPVTVYRLLTSGTYEAHMYDVATAKLDLDRAVLDGMAGGKRGATKRTRDFQEHLLKRSAAAVNFGAGGGGAEGETKAAASGPEEEGKKAEEDFAAASNKEEETNFKEQSLDDILATRSRKVVLRTGEGGGALESLSTATFVNNKANNDVDLDDPDFWSKTLGHALEEHQKVVALNDKDKSRAAKTKVSYNEEAFFLSPTPSSTNGGGKRRSDLGDSSGGDSPGGESLSFVEETKATKRKKQPSQQPEKKPKKDHLNVWKKTHLNALKQQLLKRGVGHASEGFVAGSKELESRAKLTSADDVKQAARTVVLSHARAAVEVLAKARKRETARYFYEEAEAKTDRSYLVEAARRTLRRNKAVFVAADEEARLTKKKKKRPLADDDDDDLGGDDDDDDDGLDDDDDENDDDDLKENAEDEDRNYRAALALVDWEKPRGSNLAEVCFSGKEVSELKTDDDIRATQALLDKYHQQEVIHIVVERINRLDYKHSRSSPAKGGVPPPSLTTVSASSPVSLTSSPATKKHKISNEAKLFEALGDNDPPTDAKPSSWWRAKHDCALLKFADHHGAAISERMRLDFFVTFASHMPDDVKAAVARLSEARDEKHAAGAAGQPPHPVEEERGGPVVVPPPPLEGGVADGVVATTRAALEGGHPSGSPPEGAAPQRLPPRAAAAAVVLPTKEELKKRLVSLVLTVVAISPRDSIFRGPRQHHRKKVRNGGGHQHHPGLTVNTQIVLPANKKPKPSPIYVDVDAEPADYPTDVVDDDVIILDGPPEPKKKKKIQHQQPITNYFLKEQLTQQSTTRQYLPPPGGGGGGGVPFVVQAPPQQHHHHQPLL